MFESLKVYCQRFVQLSEEELNLIDQYFEIKILKKKEFLLKDQSVCQFLAFIDSGIIRHFHVRDGDEKTCEISFENAWATDFQSFNNQKPSVMNLQALEETRVFMISRDHLHKAYSQSKQFETFGRIMAEQVAEKATEIVMSLSSDKPETRYLKLVESNNELFQRVPKKYIANLLGISPESLSRIQNRIYQKKQS